MSFSQFSARIYCNRSLVASDPFPMFKQSIVASDPFPMFKQSIVASDPFPMFKQSVDFYTFYCHIKKSTDV